MLPTVAQLAALITAPEAPLPIMLVMATRPINAYLDVVVRSVPGESDTCAPVVVAKDDLLSSRVAHGNTCPL